MPNEAAWRAEARIFAAYLGSPAVPMEIVERYRLAVDDWTSEPSGFDRWLLRFAASHPMLTSLADAYARFVRPYGDLRRRLTLMVALLESHGATHQLYDSARHSSAAVAWLSLAGSGAAWAVRTVVAFIVVAPLHAIASVAAPAARQRS